MKKIFATIMVVFMLIMMAGCGMSDTSSYSYGSEMDTAATQEIADKLQINQPTPKDIDYSLERYNLIRRAYWVNGQREKANMLPCEIEKPLGYIILLTDNGAVVGKFIVDGKVSSLNSFLTPDSEYYERDTNIPTRADNDWLADVDGSYGENDNGIFFFTPDGRYIEYTGIYLYSDIPFEISNPVVTYSEGN